MNRRGTFDSLGPPDPFAELLALLQGRQIGGGAPSSQGGGALAPVPEERGAPLTPSPMPVRRGDGGSLRGGGRRVETNRLAGSAREGQDYIELERDGTVFHIYGDGTDDRQVVAFRRRSRPAKGPV